MSNVAPVTAVFTTDHEDGLTSQWLLDLIERPSDSSQPS
jgi:hypothetical protein